MQKKNGLLIFSPTDLTRFMESPFASWMDRFAIEQPDQCPEKDPQDALSSVLANMGYDHENAQEQKFITEGLSFIKIEGASDTEKSEKSIKAMHQAVDIIAQARLELGQFAGYADFLVKVNHSENCQPSLLGDYHYEVWDTKLASKVKPTFIVQLCCYSEMLKAIQGVMPHKMVVFLGNQEREEFKTLDFHYKYQSLKKSFLTSQQQFDATSMPDPADSKSWAHWSNYAEQLLVEKDHLFQIAGITQSQIKKLNRGGILTMQQLVDTDEEERIKKLNPASFKKLKSQASIQKQSIDCIIPKFEIIVPEAGKKMGLALLPPHSPYDVFFDIEGFPLEKDGLEYLWGCAYFNEAGTRDFKDFWAHNQAQEKEAFEGFIRWAFNRWKKDPTMHIYHYASYEITACRKLMGRYGVCENEVDQLLRNDVFVDLYKIVKGGLLLGEPRYSLKNVEHLYRDKRNTEVGSGGDSMVVYEQWRELHIAGKEGNTWQTSKTLKDIRDYNIDDCNSTQELTDWLRVEQNKKGIGFLGRTEVIEVEQIGRAHV